MELLLDLEIEKEQNLPPQSVGSESVWGPGMVTPAVTFYGFSFPIYFQFIRTEGSTTVLSGTAKPHISLEKLCASSESQA